MNPIYEQGLDKQLANYAALTPVQWVDRSADIFGDLPAVIHGQRRYTWAQCRERSARLAAALLALGAKRGSTVSVMLPNTPEMIEAHYAIPAINAVINALNTRLDAPLLAWQMAHCEASILITDSEFAPTMRSAVQLLREQHNRTIVVIDVCDSEYAGTHDTIGLFEYEALLAAHQPVSQLTGAQDEWDAIAVSYTSGTTGNPKGVVTHHRGAYLNAVCNVTTWAMPHFPQYLWTLPLFHCNGWCFAWTVALQGGTHICMRRVDVPSMLRGFVEHGATHYCAAPVVHNMLLAEHAKTPSAFAAIRQPVKGMVAAASPPASMIEGMAHVGFDITHVYGLTEVYGPASVCAKRSTWAQETVAEQTRLNGRQGVRYALQAGMTVMNPDTMQPVAADGQTMGEIMFRGNITMRGYLKNSEATAEAFAGGWFHSGDLAVIEPDGYIRIKDRSKDIIISGGENISSLEVEDALYRHPAVLHCAVVAKPNVQWGEVPLAFIELKSGANASAEELITHCKSLLANYKCPKDIYFAEIPKTATGKIQKFALRTHIASKGLI